ncbi:uracil-DNA glycosylase [Demequina iriomotensis]|uniref:uracil-DNA glycosylase n=1 Tax=Demequina iriomotensis TaxID=1536641 RepID=UPI00078597B6|nr:uracil-DNA glycosylase [Demequina iriomotensis]
MHAEWLDSMARDWAGVLAPAAPTLERLAAELGGEAYLPAPESVMRAFALPLADVRVLLVGQDPYPTPGDAVGLSFSVAPGRPMPRSLANIARELRADTGEELASGDLSPWVDQGVMLLNRVLTVRPGEAGSHQGRGWEAVTAIAIEALAARGGPLVALLWGRQAQALAPLLGDVPRVESAHPSPLSASRGFFGSRPFSRVNALLEEQDAAPVRWGAPPDGSALF